MRFVLGESELMSSKEWKEKSGKREKLSGKWQRTFAPSVGGTLPSCRRRRSGDSESALSESAATSKSSAADTDSPESESEPESAGLPYRTVTVRKTHGESRAGDRRVLSPACAMIS